MTKDLVIIRNQEEWNVMHHSKYADGVPSTFPFLCLFIAEGFGYGYWVFVDAEQAQELITSPE